MGSFWFQRYVPCKMYAFIYTLNFSLSPSIPIHEMFFYV